MSRRGDLLAEAAAALHEAIACSQDAGGLVTSAALTERVARMLAAAQGDAILELADRLVAERAAGSTAPLSSTETGARSVPGTPSASINGSDNSDSAARARRRRRLADAATHRAADRARQADLVDLSRGCAVAELALVWSISIPAARRRMAVARALATPGRLPQAWAAARSGRLEWAKAEVLQRATEQLSDDQAARVEAMVVPWACQAESVEAMGPVDIPFRTIPAFRTGVAVAIHAVAPEGAAERAAAARRKRSVRCYQVDVAMGRLEADLPVEEIVRLSGILREAVELARQSHDTRSADQVRADTLVDLMAGGALEALSLASLDAEVAGSAEQPDGEGPSDAAESQGSRGQSKSGNGCDCGRRCGRPNVGVLIPLSTLLGLSEEPGTLEGYGPIGAALARDLAQSGVWRCIGVDDDHGTLLGLGVTSFVPRYGPSPVLRRLVEDIWQGCSVPGCGRRAKDCDLDHREPWPEGATCDCNLHPLCRRCHRLKTAGLLLVQPSQDPIHPAGTLIWTSAVGRSYVSRPPSAGAGAGGGSVPRRDWGWQAKGA